MDLSKDRLSILCLGAKLRPGDTFWSPSTLETLSSSRAFGDVFYTKVRGERKGRGTVNKLLERLNFEKLLCLKQRKRATLVAKFERSPVNFKFVCSQLKIAVY